MNFNSQMAKYKEAHFSLFSGALCFPCVPDSRGKPLALKVFWALFIHKGVFSLTGDISLEI